MLRGRHRGQAACWCAHGDWAAEAESCGEGGQGRREVPRRRRLGCAGRLLLEGLLLEQCCQLVVARSLLLLVLLLVALLLLRPGCSEQGRGQLGWQRCGGLGDCEQGCGEVGVVQQDELQVLVAARQLGLHEPILVLCRAAAPQARCGCLCLWLCQDWAQYSEQRTQHGPPGSPAALMSPASSCFSRLRAARSRCSATSCASSVAMCFSFLIFARIALCTAAVGEPGMGHKPRRTHPGCCGTAASQLPSLLTARVSCTPAGSRTAFSAPSSPRLSPAQRLSGLWQRPPVVRGLRAYPALLRVRNRLRSCKGELQFSSSSA